MRRQVRRNPWDEDLIILGAVVVGGAVIVHAIQQAAPDPGKGADEAAQLAAHAVGGAANALGTGAHTFVDDIGSLLGQIGAQLRERHVLGPAPNTAGTSPNPGDISGPYASPASPGTGTGPTNY